ncbi:MAG: PA2778 family cysteine peptidase [Oceanospirillaceae bacterium]|nr:PA2778 family cysteine peptidase [Oceanospirillaceae bacterium]
MLRFPAAVRLTAALLCLLWLGGCASQLPASRMATLTDSLPVSTELRDVPFYPQELYQCGPAALATVLNYHQRPVSPETLVPQIYIPERQGSLQIEMKVATRRYGLPAFEGPDDLDGLLAEIAAGHPVIVLQNLGLDWFPQWHYAVAVGYNLSEQVLILRSGTEKRRITPLGLFERTWSRGGYWSLLMLPPQVLPIQIEPVNAVRAALELEASSAEAARQSLQASARRWPDHYLVQMASGNAELTAGQAASASSAFRRALELKPGAADAWNNLAYSLEAEGCGVPARDAIACARALAPKSGQIRESARELMEKPVVTYDQCDALPSCPAAP